MKPYYTIESQNCNDCDAELYIGYEAITVDDTIYCNRECLLNELLSTTHVIDIYLTDDETLKDVD